MSKSKNKFSTKLNDNSTIADLKSLSFSELNTFLLELYNEKTSELNPSKLLDQYRNNRFVKPSDIDAMAIRKTELQWLEIAKNQKFEPIVLSPLAPLGTSSVVAHVHQNNVVSALRNTEIVSDATNVLALQVADDFQQNKFNNAVQRYSAVHRHVRGQAFDNPKFSAHFSTFCLASGGLDPGNFEFELNELDKHLSLTYDILSKYFQPEEISLHFYLKKDSDLLLTKISQNDRDYFWKRFEVRLIDDFEHDYYQLIQFKFFVKKGADEYNIADGGLVNWTQKLLNSQKHRCMISGIGIELLHRLL